MDAGPPKFSKVSVGFWIFLRILLSWAQLYYLLLFPLGDEAYINVHCAIATHPPLWKGKRDVLGFLEFISGCLNSRKPSKVPFLLSWWCMYLAAIVLHWVKDITVAFLFPAFRVDLHYSGTQSCLAAVLLLGWRWLTVLSLEMLLALGLTRIANPFSVAAIMVLQV